MSNWGQYFSNVNDKLSSILVDLDLKEQLPDDVRTNLIWIWIYMNSPRVDGLSSSEEFQTLNQIEDVLGSRLKSEYNACLAGRITGDGRREVYYYGRACANLGSIVKAEMASFPGYRFDCDSQPDPEWRQYVEVLYPTEENLECIKNMAVLETLANAGNKPEIERPVWHYVFFNSEDGLRRFIQWSETNGFQVTERSRADGPGTLDPGMVSIVRSQTTIPDDIDNCVVEVVRAAKGFGGEYDGWETSVEKT